MAGEWRTETFENAPLQVIDGDRGANYPNQAQFSAAGHCLFLNAGNVTTNGFRFSDCAFITAEKDATLRKGKLVRNDVVLTTRGTVGNAAYFDDFVPFDHIRINSGMVILRAETPALHPRYLYHFVRSALFHAQESALQTGSAQPQLPIQDINRVEIPIPPPDEQYAIAHILGTLDDKIELNRRMNETLETMARALFKSWFVDFDPVRAKHALSKVEGAEGRPSASLEQAFTGLPQALADLFPDSLEDSELGEIPKGWQVGRLDEIARFLNGLALQKYPPADGRSLPVIKIAQLRGGNTNGADRASADLQPDYIVQDGDILFSWSGSLECVLWAGGRGALNQHLFRVTSENYPRWLCYLGVHHHLDDFRHIAAGKATTMGHIQRHHLSDAKLAVPSPELLRAMDRSFQPLVESLWQRAVQSRTLSILRDTLLPKLISGELRVTVAEQMAENA